MFARITALLLLTALPLSASADIRLKDDPPPGPAAPANPQPAAAAEPSFVLSYLVGAMLSAGVLLIVCTPGRKA
jgi:hypothetical protein